MNRNDRRVPTVFGPETRFAVFPALTTLRESAFSELKNRLLSDRLDEAWSAEMNLHIRRAANEAEALAWLTPYPLLVFPALFEERLTVETEHAERQAHVTRRSRELMAA